MYHLHESIWIGVEPLLVFQALSDHEWFLKGPNLNCQLVKHGHEQKNGIGAIRKVVTARSIFTEKITAFRPVEHYEYKIQSLEDARGRPIRLQHERGWLDFSVENDGTRVDWHSQYDFSLPIVGNIVEIIVSWQVKKIFASLLQRAKFELELSSTSKWK